MTSKVEFKNSGPPVSEADIDAFERERGVSLPDAYRRFLMAHNGGRPHPNGFPMSGGCGRVIEPIQYFLSIGEPYSLAQRWHDFKHPEYPRMPPEFAPIAKCPGGDLLVIATAGKQLGEVFFWDHEEEGDETYTYDNLTPVAASVDELLGALTEG